MIATVTLNPSVDRMWVVPRLGFREPVRALEASERAGGKGINVAEVVAELGGRSRAFTLAGGETGRHFRRLAARAGVPLKCFPIRGETRLNVGIRESRTGREFRVLGPAPRVSPKEFQALRRAVAGNTRFFAVVFSGSLPAGVPASAYGDFIALLQNRGTRCALDADGNALRLGVAARPFCVKPNEYELGRLLGTSFRTRRAIVRAAMRLHGSGIACVVVSLERRGALFCCGGKPLFVRPPTVPVKARVGAGDALLAGFLLGLERDLPVPEAARLGVAAASAAVAGVSSRRIVGRRDVTRLFARTAAGPV